MSGPSAAPRRPRAVIIGVGAEAGLGAGLCRRFAAGGYHVLAVGRSAERLAAVTATIAAAGHSAEAVAADASDEAAVLRLFDAAMADDDHAPAEIVVFNVSNNRPAPLREEDAAGFEQIWRDACFGGFLVGREAARRMVPLGRGTVIFTGASGSLRGRPNYAAFAVAKAGLRALAQSMAREFGPAGIHVAHVVLDGMIDGQRLRDRAPARIAAAGPDGLLAIDAIAETYWQLHRQPRAAWTHELDLRPFKESF